MNDGKDMVILYIWMYLKRKKKWFLLSLAPSCMRKDGLIGFTQQCDDFDGHSMVSKMVIEFYL